MRSAISLLVLGSFFEPFGDSGQLVNVTASLGFDCFHSIEEPIVSKSGSQILAVNS